MHTIFIYECSPGRLTLSFVKSDYVRDNVFLKNSNSSSLIKELYDTRCGTKANSTLIRHTALATNITITSVSFVISMAISCSIVLAMNVLDARRTVDINPPRATTLNDPLIRSL